MIGYHIHTGVYNMCMKKSKRIRKNIMVDPNLMIRARKILNAPNDSQAIEQALNTSTAGRKTEEELRQATIDLTKHMRRYKIKPLFS